MTKKNKTNEALTVNHCLFVGTTGSGKTYQIKRHRALRIAKRVLIWDPDGTYKLKGMKRAKSADEIKQFLQGKPYSFNFTISLEADTISEAEFEKFCAIALTVAHAKYPLAIIIEELADVARIGKASPNWGQLSRKVRKYGGIIIAASQKPQEIDKTFIDQCAVFGVGLLKTKTTRKYAAEMLDITEDELKTLKPMDWFFRRDADPAIRVDFGQKMPKGFKFLK